MHHHTTTMHAPRQLTPHPPPRRRRLRDPVTTHAPRSRWEQRCESSTPRTSLLPGCQLPGMARCPLVRTEPGRPGPPHAPPRASGQTVPLRRSLHDAQTCRPWRMPSHSRGSKLRLYELHVSVPEVMREASNHTQPWVAVCRTITTMIPAHNLMNVRVNREYIMISFMNRTIRIQSHNQLPSPTRPKQHEWRPM